MKKALLLVTPLALVAACTSPANTADAMNDNTIVPESETSGMSNEAASDMASGTVPATVAATYVEMAAAGDKFEVDSSRLVLETTKNADIRRFAQMMVDDHTASTGKIKTAADKAKVAVPAPVLSPEQQRMLGEIRSASGTERDKLYLAHQRAAHTEALALHQGYAERGESDPLKQVAGEIAPVVQRHLSELEGISAS